jgi:DNA polymerase eta
VIASAGDKLWKELVGNDAKMNLTHVALSFTGIDVTEAGQQSIETFLKSGNNDKRPRETDGLGIASIEQGYSTRVTELSSQDFPSTSYTCAKCGKKLTIFLDSDVMDDSDPLEILRTEHEDFHFAQELAKDLAQESKLRDSSPKKGTASKSAKRRRVELKGIEKFLLRK